MTTDDDSILDELWPAHEPPDGFADRVLDAVTPRRPRSLRPLLLLSAIAAVIALATPLWIAGAPRSQFASAPVEPDLGLVKD